MEGPTKTAWYNQLLLDWARQRCPSEPECEGCECDLTGQDVFETSTMNCCETCFNDMRDAGSPSDELLRRLERQQMGIC